MKNFLKDRMEPLMQLLSCIKSTCLQGIYIAITFTICMSLEDILLPVLQRFTDNIISKLHIGWVICATLLVILLFFIYFVKKVINKCRVSKWFLSNLILVSLIYTRYRNYSDEFVFLGWNKFYYLDVLYTILVLLIVYSFFTYIIPLLISLCKGKKDKENYLLRDDEIDDPAKDLLGYDKQVKNLSNLLETVDVRKRAYSVGIVGEWGVGKSSLLKLFAKHKIQQGDIVIRFNPRHAKSTSFIQEDFFNQLRAELGKYSGNIGIRIDKYAYALQLTTPTKWFYAIWDLFTNWTADTEKQRVNEVLRSLNRNIYIITEDLDRLTGEEIIEVLKLIDANGNFCNTFFLTAYDKHYVNGILKRTLKLDNDSTDYTDKYFNYEYPLMELSQSQLQNVLDILIRDWAISHTLPEFQTYIGNEHWMMVSGYLKTYLPTLRQIKRYTNLLYSTYPVVANRVLFHDFALLTLVRFLDAKAYMSLYYKSYITNYIDSHHEKYYALCVGYEKLADQYPRIKNFKHILRQLFDRYINQFPEYNSINRVESFGNYFYRYTGDKVNFIQLDALHETDNIEESIVVLDKYLQSKSHCKSIEEFFTMYKFKWFKNNVHLQNYIFLLLYVAAKINSSSLHYRLYYMLQMEAFEELCVNKIIYTKEEYLAIWSNGFHTMLSYIPVYIGLFLTDRINERKKYDSEESTVVDDMSFDVNMALDAMYKYDESIDTIDWRGDMSLDLSLVCNKKNNEPEDRAKDHLLRMMHNYPDKYAQSLIQLEMRSRGLRKQEPYTHISLYKHSMLVNVIYGVEQFVEWIEQINSQDLKYIICTLHDEGMRNNVPSYDLSYIAEQDYSNYALIADFLKKRVSLQKEDI